MLPRRVTRVQVPPIKTQGIKTKLVPFILANIKWNGRGRWIEPFMGSGVVMFNSGARAGVGADSNAHIVRFYSGILKGTITPQTVRAFLESEGSLLRDKGEVHYYDIRKRFNADGNPLDFLFLNRSCFNGVMRFNKKGGFNVPFCRKPERFGKLLVTKICNQVAAIHRLMLAQPDAFAFRHQSWRDTLADVGPDDFVYLDPPYVGRHTDYFNQWSDKDANDLALTAQKLPCGFALSMWLENHHRRNTHIDSEWSGLPMRTASHFYHVGSFESLRAEMSEALVIKPGFITPESEVPEAAFPVEDEGEESLHPLELFL